MSRFFDVESRHSNKKKGIFISFSGIDGSGKSTCINYLDKQLSIKYGIKNICCIDGLKPGLYSLYLRKTAKQLDSDIITLFGDLVPMSSAADLKYTHDYQICNLLDEGNIVITHRNDLCCRVYSSLREFHQQTWKFIEDALADYTKPDLHFFLETSINEALDRISKRKGEALSINENEIFLTKARDEYHKLICSSYQDVIIIDTNAKSIDEIMKDIMHHIEKIL